MILDVAGLTFNYNNHPVLDGIDFFLSPGSFLQCSVPTGWERRPC